LRVTPAMAQMAAATPGPNSSASALAVRFLDTNSPMQTYT